MSMNVVAAVSMFLFLATLIKEDIPILDINNILFKRSLKINKWYLWQNNESAVTFAE